jgi:hypothetical protein
MTERGKARRVSRLEVVIRQLVNDAMRSDPRAIRLLMLLAERYIGPADVSNDADELPAEDQAILKAFVAETLLTGVTQDLNANGADQTNEERD